MHSAFPGDYAVVVVALALRERAALARMHARETVAHSRQLQRDFAELRRQYLAWHPAEG